MQNLNDEIPDPMNWSIYNDYLEKQQEEEEKKKEEKKEEPKKVETWRDRPAML